jgi:hypothetical protein
MNTGRLGVRGAGLGDTLAPIVPASRKAAVASATFIGLIGAWVGCATA